jgi:F420-dependent oxidoreductase-like protein
MKLGITIGMIRGARPQLEMDVVEEAERLGCSAVWCGESYGTDAVTPIAWVLARTTRIKAGTGIMQMPARTPTCAAMTAMTLQALSDDRFLCGVGPSGPQVAEGWHGQPYGNGLGRTREYIEIIRRIIAREAPLTHEGEHYQIPYRGPGASGLGKPLRSIIHARPTIPIYTASITPGGMRLSGEIADGNLPIFMSPERAEAVTGPTLEGRAKAGKTDLSGYDIAPYTKIRMGADLQACRDAIKPELALYIGGMGARGKNFYNDYAKKLGYADAARVIQDLYLDGKKTEAAAAVPDRLCDEVALLGPPDRIKGRLQDWKAIAREGKVGTVVLTGATIEALRVAAEAVL